MICAKPLFAALLLAPAVAGCTQFPALEHTITQEVEEADYPALVPIEPLIAQANAAPAVPAQTQQGLEARLAGLRARADRLRGSVLTGAEKQRLQGGLR